ncbi:hypothetical protein Csa_006043 [Cucumis sativus]|uniref:Uncharacterized protein n=1 Tax=Cucumis sativus TaxID=3659 RepID=A0A0A0LK34_CUCSA|nr:hypothetical protein Csa_006043 [Cucumis sativus]
MHPSLQPHTCPLGTRFSTTPRPQRGVAMAAAHWSVTQRPDQDKRFGGDADRHMRRPRGRRSPSFSCHVVPESNG